METNFVMKERRRIFLGNSQLILFVANLEEEWREKLFNVKNELD